MLRVDLLAEPHLRACLNVGAVGAQSRRVRLLQLDRGVVGTLSHHQLLQIVRGGPVPSLGTTVS